MYLCKGLEYWDITPTVARPILPVLKSWGTDYNYKTYGYDSD